MSRKLCHTHHPYMKVLVYSLSLQEDQKISAGGKTTSLLVRLEMDLLHYGVKWGEHIKLHIHLHFNLYI